MKIIDYLKTNGSLDDFANLMVYPEEANDMGHFFTVWRCRTITGKSLDCYEDKKEDAIAKAKEYLNKELGDYR